MPDLWAPVFSGMVIAWGFPHHRVAVAFPVENHAVVVLPWRVLNTLQKIFSFFFKCWRFAMNGIFSVSFRSFFSISSDPLANSICGVATWNRRIFFSFTLRNTVVPGQSVGILLVGFPWSAVAGWGGRRPGKKKKKGNWVKKRVDHYAKGFWFCGALSIKRCAIDLIRQGIIRESIGRILLSNIWRSRKHVPLYVVREILCWMGRTEREPQPSPFSLVISLFHYI